MVPALASLRPYPTPNVDESDDCATTSPPTAGKTDVTVVVPLEEQPASAWPRSPIPAAHGVRIGEAGATSVCALAVALEATTIDSSARSVLTSVTSRPATLRCKISVRDPPREKR